MAKAKGIVAGLYKQRQRGKRTRQGLGRGTKWGSKGSKRYKKKPRGQGK